MADIFSHEDAKFLLQGKRVLFIGDSNVRAQYKDMVWLLNANSLISPVSLRNKLELSYLGDRLVHRSKLHRGRDFEEVRHFIDEYNETVVDFMFVPRCYNKKIEDLFNSFKGRLKDVPNIIVMNSCLWDLCRWGPNGVREYKDNMVKLMRLMNLSLPKECLVIWMTALPIAEHVRGGLIIKQIEFMESLLKFEIMEANTFAREVVANHGYDVLDNHYYNRMQIHRRAKDGVHFLPVPVRFITNLLLTHISLSWGERLSDNFSSILLTKAIANDCTSTTEKEVKLPAYGLFSKSNHSAVQRNRGLKITIDANKDGRVSRIYQGERPYQKHSKYERFCHESEYSRKGNGYENQESTSSVCGGPYRYRNKRKYRKKFYY